MPVGLWHYTLLRLNFGGFFHGLWHSKKIDLKHMFEWSSPLIFHEAICTIWSKFSIKPCDIAIQYLYWRNSGHICRCLYISYILFCIVVILFLGKNSKTDLCPHHSHRIQLTAHTHIFRIHRDASEWMNLFFRNIIYC